MKTVTVIGAGISGLSAATYLARNGFRVSVFEKNADPGGRARQLRQEGFSFDMGPSWYWMPDVFEHYFSAFGKNPCDYYQLIRLDPGYRVFFSPSEYLDVHADIKKIEEVFERTETGAGEALRKFLAKAGFNYRTGMGEIVRIPGLSPLQYVRPEILWGLARLNLLGSISKSIRGRFHDKKLVQLLEFPVLFLGALPQQIPALYSLMNYADMMLGTWYPMGGMVKIVEGMVELAESLGVGFHFNAGVENILITGRKVQGISAGGNEYPTDILLASADYHHIEQEILPPDARTYTQKYWNKRTMAPSSLLFYIGLNKKIGKLLHHNLFFDIDFDAHARSIYSDPQWPETPALYISCTSRTDPSVAPAGCENLTVLIPVATDIEDHEEIRERYYDYVIQKIEHITGEPVRRHVIFRNIYGYRDFIRDYHSFRGNAYGLANTLVQTAFLKPRMKSRKITNLYYAGQLTVPGPGVPPALISGEIAGKVITEKHR